jgi:Rrf2 family transcriptional regulator, nitric oxide-sensitive transcriptional repressor
MIPKTAEYALRAVVMLAREPQRAYSAEQIAGATRVPRRYTHKVLQGLVRAELVRSQSGPGGGYALVRPPEDLSILDVVNAVQPIPRIRHCPLGLKSHTSLCPLHRELDEACAATERAFARVTIAQLLNQPDAVPPLCELGQDGDTDRPRAHRSGRSQKEKEPASRMRECPLK